MIDALIRWSLDNKLIVLTMAAILLAWGGWQAVRLPVDVLPDLTAPTVTIHSGALAIEEVVCQLDSNLGARRQAAPFSPPR